MSNFYKEIYNQETKEFFLDSIDVKQYPFRWWERVFERSELFEKRYGKDLYGFTTSEIIEFYKFYDAPLESLMILNTNLIKYGNWAMQNNLLIDGQNHYAELTNETLNTCVSKILLTSSIISWDDLHKLIKQFYNDTDKYVFFALFEGIKGNNYSDLLNLKMSDIDEYNNTATIRDKTIKVSPDFIKICKLADQEMIYETDYYDKKLIPSEYIYKEKCNSRGINKPRTIYATITRMINKYGLSNYLSTNSIFHSGFIYYLNERANKYNTTVKELFENRELIQDIIDKYNFNPSTTKRFLLKYEELLK